VVLTAVFGKLIVVGLNVTAGAIPVPETLIMWGLPLALSVISSRAERAPVVVGVNVTVTVMVAPAATLIGRVADETAKSPGFDPANERSEIVRVPLPTLLMYTVVAAVVCPTGWLPKGMFPGE